MSGFPAVFRVFTTQTALFGDSQNFSHDEHDARNSIRYFHSQKDLTGRNHHSLASVIWKERSAVEFKAYVPVNSKTSHLSPPHGQSPGIWLVLSSVQWEIWPKMRPAQWGIWLSYQNVCQWSETKGFLNSFIQQVSRARGSLLLSIPRRFFYCRFI